MILYYSIPYLKLHPPENPNTQNLIEPKFDWPGFLDGWLHGLTDFVLCCIFMLSAIYPYTTGLESNI